VTLAIHGRVLRRLLPKGYQARDDLDLKVIPEGEHCRLTMIEDPPRSHPRY
jgi:hypothetical protein